MTSSQEIKKLLSSHQTLLLDGATGSNYFLQGLAAGHPPEFWNEEQQQKVIDLHSDFIQSGADAIWTNSFGGNSERLKLHKATDKTQTLNHLAVTLAHKARSSHTRPVLIAGSVGPTGSLIVPNGPLSLSDATLCFQEQIQALRHAGADFIAFETFSSFEESKAALQAAASLKAPCSLSLSFDSPRSRTMMGIDPNAFVDFIHSQPYKPFAIGANCGIGPRENITTLLGIKNALHRTSLHNTILLIGKPNRGIPRYQDGHVSYSGTDNDLDHYVTLAYNLGISLIGGCCGTTPQNLAVMRKTLDNCLEKPPSLDISSETINDFFPSHDTDITPSRTRRSRRRSS